MRSSSKGPWGNGGHRECGEGPAGIPGPYPGPLGVHVRAGVAQFRFQAPSATVAAVGRPGGVHGDCIPTGTPSLSGWPVPWPVPQATNVRLVGLHSLSHKRAVHVDTRMANPHSSVRDVRNRPTELNPNDNRHTGGSQWENQIKIQ